MIKNSRKIRIHMYLAVFRKAQSRWTKWRLSVAFTLIHTQVVIRKEWYASISIPNLLDPFCEVFLFILTCMIFPISITISYFLNINRGQSLKALQLQQFKAVYSHVSQQVWQLSMSHICIFTCNPRQTSYFTRYNRILTR